MNKLEVLSYLNKENPKKIAILLHGYGDQANNFISLAKSLKDKSLEINYYAPNAPFAVPQHPLGRQWFNPYPNGIHYNEVGKNEKEIMKQEIEESIKQLYSYIKQLLSKKNLLHQDLFLIGFSQGAMIAYELGNYINKQLAGCVMLSGRILSKNNFTNKLFSKTSLLILHGDSDDIVSPKYFAESCKIAKLNKLSFESHLLHNEGHNISLEMLQITQKFLKKNM